MHNSTDQFWYWVFTFLCCSIGWRLTTKKSLFFQILHLFYSIIFPIRRTLIRLLHSYLNSYLNKCSSGNLHSFSLSAMLHLVASAFKFVVTCMCACIGPFSQISIMTERCEQPTFPLFNTDCLCVCVCMCVCVRESVLYIVCYCSLPVPLTEC